MAWKVRRGFGGPSGSGRGGRLCGPTWTSACRGAPSSSAREASPTSPSHLIRKQRVPPPHFTTSRGRGAPPRPPCRGSSSHSRTRKHLLLRKMVLTQLCRQGEQPTRTTRKANKTEQPTRALQETTLSLGSRGLDQAAAPALTRAR